MDESAITVLLWGATLLLLSWTWLPSFLSGLGGSRYSNGGSEDPTILDPAPGDVGYAFWHEQILRLGYVPLGTAWMKITFHGPVWRHQTDVRVFVSKVNRTFVFIQKQPKPLDVWWPTMFATCWTDGGMLLTSNVVDQPPDSGEFVIQGIETENLEESEALHLQRRDADERAGKNTDRDLSLETLLRATQRNAGPAARYQATKMGQTYLASHFMIHLFLSIPVVYLRSWDDWALPLVNLILGGLLFMGDYSAKKRAGAMLSEQARAKHRETTTR